MPNELPADRRDAADAVAPDAPAAREYSRGYNPAPHRRHVRRNGEAQHGCTPFITKSFTRDGVQHHPTVDLATGEVFCDCEDFSYTLAPKARRNHEIPNLTQPEYCCKHILRAIENCRRRGEIPAAPSTPTPVSSPAPTSTVEEFEIEVLFDEECGDFWAYVNGQVEAMAGTYAEAEREAQEYVARMKRQRRDEILSRSDEY